MSGAGWQSSATVLRGVSGFASAVKGSGGRGGSDGDIPAFLRKAGSSGGYTPDDGGAAYYG